MTTDTTEAGLEDLIVASLTGLPLGAVRASPAQGVEAGPQPYVGLHDYRLGDPKAYDREYAVDLQQLTAFLASTQPAAAEALALEADGPTRRKFLSRLQGEVGRRGVIDVLRHGVSHGQHHLSLFYGTPSRGNATAATLNALNRFSVTRQLRYARDGPPWRSTSPSSSTACRCSPSS